MRRTLAVTACDQSITLDTICGVWADIAMGRVVYLSGSSVEALQESLDPLPADAPAFITFRPCPEISFFKTISALLDDLETAAIDLFPAWLPGAEHIEGPGGAGLAAVRVLAKSLAATTSHFGPFVADLATRALRGDRQISQAFAHEVRACGLVRVLAASYGRSSLAILTDVPEDLTAAEEDSLVTACEWLALQTHSAVCLTGAPVLTVDRISIAPSSPPEPKPEAPAELVSYPPPVGKPHPRSNAECRLESALATRPWATGRRWNTTYQSHVLCNPIRIDLMWTDERCAIEVDGPEHHAPLKYAEDRRRDIQLQLDGFAVLRFTNDQVLHQLTTVLSEIEQFLTMKRKHD